MLRPRSVLDLEAEKRGLGLGLDGLGLGLMAIGLGLMAIGLGLVAFWPRGLAQKKQTGLNKACVSFFKRCKLLLPVLSSVYACHKIPRKVSL